MASAPPNPPGEAIETGANASKSLVDSSVNSGLNQIVEAAANETATTDSPLVAFVGSINSVVLSGLLVDRILARHPVRRLLHRCYPPMLGRMLNDTFRPCDHARTRRKALLRSFQTERRL